MSAIGDYVHLTYSGYYEKTGAPKTPSASSYTKAIETRERQFNAWLNKQENSVIKRLQKETQASLNLLKPFRRGGKSNNDIGKVKTNEVIMSLLNDLWETLEVKYLTVDKISAASSGILNEAGFGAGENVGKTAAGARTEAQKEVVSNINQQISDLLNKTLLEITNSINEILKPEEIKTSQIESAIEKTQNSISSFIGDLQKQYKVLDTSEQQNTFTILQDIFKDLIKSIQENEKTDANVDIIGTLNTIAKGLSAGKQVNQYKGDISEALIAVMGEHLAGEIIPKVNGVIKSAEVSGGERSSRGINVDYFSNSIDFEKTLQGKKFKKPYGDFIVSAESVQDKVDIKIELSDNSHAYISAKNYNTKNLSKRSN